MTEKLINIETAKLAKEKGFNLLVRNYFVKDAEREGSLVNWNNINPLLISRPTQSLLQKWLREEYKIDIYIIGYGFGYYPQLNNVPPTNQGDVKYIDRRWNMPPKEENSNYKTYEEALEKGLQEALKLI